LKNIARSALIIFPLATLLNSFSMTALMLVVGVAGQSNVAAEIGLVQGATLALFYAFSANARNLILADASGLAAICLLQSRLLLLLPLAGAAYFLSVVIGTASAPLALVLIFRRMSEWMGEIGLARHERLNQTGFALHALAAECIGLFLCLLLPLWVNLDLAISAIPWAFAPLLAIRHAQLSLRGGEGHTTLSLLLPHFGSTAIIGTSIYVFRISIALLAGKEIAGELFTAFAIGGIIPTFFGQALAPTLTHRFGVSGGLNKWLLLIPAAMLLIAAGILMLVTVETNWFLSFGHSTIFWLAVGFSIGGGAIMSVAAVLRTRLIQQADGRVVFGADLLTNVLIVASVPVVFHLLGPESMAGLFGLSSCLNLAFLWRAGNRRGMDRPYFIPVLLGIGVLLILPVFFLIDGSLFRDPSFVFDTGGAIARLPLPVSVLALFVGIALLGDYVAAARSLTVLFITVLLFVVTSLAAEQGNSANEGAKLILLAQFLLPMFGLVLGQMYGAATQEPIFERIALWMLLVIVPAQIAATWLQGHTLMSAKVFVFSIYQHLQYFPMIVVALVIMASLALWNYGTVTRMALTVLMPAAMVQIVGSQSMMAVFGAMFGLAGFALIQLRRNNSRRWAASTLVATMLCAVVYTAVSELRLPQDNASVADNQVIDMSWKTIMSTTDNDEGSVFITGISSLSKHWYYYASGVVESPRAFLLGHTTPPDRNLHPSAHNYWLDAMYNFGAVALLPLVILLLETLRALWGRRMDILSNPMLLGTAMASTYLLLGENMLKVGMRQPYPGIISFFVWGLLITRLRTTEKDEKVGSMHS
jgi:hypothetical protein